MNSKQIQRHLYNRYGIRIKQYAYVNAIFMHQGVSNIELAAVLGVSRQIVGRVTRRLEEKSAIINTNPFAANSNSKKQWEVTDEATQDFLQYLGPDRPGSEPFGKSQRPLGPTGHDRMVRDIINGNRR